MKKTSWLLVLAALGICAALLTAARRLEPVGLEDAVMTVNGRKVTPQEFTIWRSAFSYSGEDFETQMKETAKIKMMQIIARENELVSAVDYEDVYEDFGAQKEEEGETPAREASPANERAFYAYILGNLRSNLISELVADGAISVAEDELKEHYQANTRLYKTPDYVVARCLYFSSDAQGLASLNALAEQAEAGLSLDGILGKPSEIGAEFSETLEVGDELGFELIENEAALCEALKTLPKGGWKVVKDELDGTKMIFVYCMSRTPGGVKPFESVRSEVFESCVQKAFDAYLEERLSLSAVIENKDAQALIS
ncbi:MAG: peptidyl-prolyl cis-trans isomerase [Clostridiales bacterium]|nr:peptidyl-prolyl cis-trans isomerase [Clostridiales bacterium]